MAIFHYFLLQNLRFLQKINHIQTLTTIPSLKRKLFQFRSVNNILYQWKVHILFNKSPKYVQILSFSALIPPFHEQKYYHPLYFNW